MLTFFPHPRTVLNPNFSLKLINTIEERISLFKKSKIDNLIVHPFTKEFSELDSEDYVKNILVDQLKAKIVLIGYDHKFGKNRTADINNLKEYGIKYNFEVIEIKAEEINDIAISSTKIRNSIEEGDIQLTNSYLGYEFSFFGKVVRGNSIGNDELGNYLVEHLNNLEIVHKDIIKDNTITPTCSIYIDESGERTIISSGYEKSNWSNLNNIQTYDSLLIDRYSIKYVKEELKKVKQNNDIFLTQAGYEEEIDYEIDFLVVSKNEIEVREANEILERGMAKWILLTSSNLPARLLSSDGVLEIVPPDFKTINATGAGDATAAYISAFGIEDVIDSVKKACAAGAIVAGTNDKPSLKMIDEISKLVEINPR